MQPVLVTPVLKPSSRTTGGARRSPAIGSGLRRPVESASGVAKPVLDGATPVRRESGRGTQAPYTSDTVDRMTP